MKKNESKFLDNVFFSIVMEIKTLPQQIKKSKHLLKATIIAHISACLFITLVSFVKLFGQRLIFGPRSRKMKPSNIMIILVILPVTLLLILDFAYVVFPFSTQSYCSRVRSLAC